MYFMRSTRSFKFKLFNVGMGIFVVLKLLQIWQHRVRTKQPNLSRKGLLVPKTRTTMPVKEYAVERGRNFAFLASCNRGPGKAIFNYALRLKQVWDIDTLHICLGTSSSLQLIDQLRTHFGSQNVITLPPTVLATSGPDSGGTKGDRLVHCQGR